MSYPSSIPQVIMLGMNSTYLASNEAGENVLYGNRIVKSTDATLIALFTDILRWRYDQYPSDSTLTGSANYLVWLCGKYQIQAQGSASGGSVIIGTGGYIYRSISNVFTTQTNTYNNAAFVGGKDFGVITINDQQYQLSKGDFSINTATGDLILNTGDFFPDDVLTVNFNMKIA